MTLSELPAVSVPLPWQAGAWQRLQQLRTDGRFPPALLITGAPGIGKEELALALARSLLCHAPGAGSNCGACRACELTAAGSHGDFRWLAPAGDSRVIKIDQVRNTLAFVAGTATFGQRKVVVISPADQLNTNAANAMLKALEEPSPSTHMVLVCTRLHRLPATIRSRCQLVKCATPDAGAALAWLDQHTDSRAQSERLLAAAEGRPLLARRLQLEAALDSVLATRAALLKLARGEISISEAAAVLADSEQTAMLQQLVSFVESAIKSLGGARLNSGPARDAFVALDALRRSQKAVAVGANPNRQLLLETLLIQVNNALGPLNLSDTMRWPTGGSNNE